MTGYPQGNFNPYSMYQNWGYGYQYPVFRGVQNVPQPVNIPQPNVNLQTPPDTVSFKATEYIQTKPKKEGLSTGAKWGLGALALAGVGTAIYFATRGRVGAKQAQQLAEHIEFKPAKTVEEAVIWGKKNLGIKEYADFGITDLDAINWVNEGMTNVCNKMKGKLTMPRLVSYSELLDNNTLAGVSSQLQGKMSKYNDYFFVNKKIFNNIDDEILKQIKTMADFYILKVEKNGMFTHYHRDIQEIKPLIEKITRYNNGELKNFKDKIDLYNNVSKCIDEYNILFNFPDRTIKKILNNTDCKKLLANKKIETDLNIIDTFNLKQKQELLDDILFELGEKVVIKHNNRSSYHTIYHEMGHLQDKILRTKAAGKYDNPSLYPKELKEWLDNVTTMNTASKVSEYATSGPGEFIAETFADLIEGRKLSDDVMDLYKKYGGPALS